MAKLVAHLNARPISTRFHIRVATVRAVHVMREPARINLPAGARRISTVKQNVMQVNENSRDIPMTLSKCHLWVRVLPAEARSGTKRAR